MSCTAILWPGGMSPRAVTFSTRVPPTSCVRAISTSSFGCRRMKGVMGLPLGSGGAVGALPARAVTRDGFLQVLLHGRPRGLGVAGADGVQHGRVLGHRGAPGGGSLEPVAQPLEQRAVARAPVAAHGIAKDFIAAGVGDRGVKGFVARRRL